VSKEKDKYEKSYEHLDNNVLVDLIQKDFDSLKKTLFEVQTRLRTAKQHGLGHNLLAHTELQKNLKPEIERLHNFLGHCLTRIAELE
jgi:hypothetical protein